MGLFLVLFFILFSVWANWSFGLSEAFFHLESWSFVAQIVTAFSIVLALIGLQEDRLERAYQKEQDKALLVGEQIGMFRKEVLPLMYEAGDLLKLIKQKTTLECPGIEMIEEFSLKYLFEKRTREAMLHNFFWLAAQKLQPEEEWGSKPQALLNALEEISIKIEASGTIDSPYLASIHGAFVRTVETFIWPLVLSAPYDEKMYPAVKYVYSNWSKNIDRTAREDIKLKVSSDIQSGADAMKNIMSTEEYNKLRKLATELDNPSKKG